MKWTALLSPDSLLSLFGLVLAFLGLLLCLDRQYDLAFECVQTALISELLKNINKDSK